MREDLGLSILLYEKQTRLINSLLHDQRMREGQPSLKGFCDLALKLESCWVTHQQDDADRFLHPKGHLATSQSNPLLTGTLTNPVTVVLIPFYFFMTYCVSFYIKNLRVYTE